VKNKEWQWLTSDEEHPHGAEGVSVDRLTGNYCRGRFEATACVERLHEYEKLRLTPDEISEMKEKLSRYEKAEKDGCIAILRYKIGDVITPEHGSDLPFRMKVTGIRFKKREGQMYLAYERNEIGRDGISTGRKIVLSAMPEDFPYQRENDDSDPNKGKKCGSDYIYEFSRTYQYQPGSQYPHLKPF